MFTSCAKLLATFLGILHLTSAHISSGQCKQNSPCSCVYDDGSVVNLEPLDGKDGKPRFSNVTDQMGDLFSWSPCSPFTYSDGTTGCVNVSVCIIRQGIPKALVYSLGKPDSANFTVDENGTLKLTYTSDLEAFIRVTEITLQCMNTSKFDFLVAEEEEINDNIILNKLLLASKYACAFPPTTTLTKVVTSTQTRSSTPPVSTTLSLTTMSSTLGPRCTSNGDFTLRCKHFYDGTKGDFKVLIVEDWDLFCGFPDNLAVALSLYAHDLSCSDVIYRCNPSLKFSLNGEVCRDHAMSGVSHVAYAVNVQHVLILGIGFFICLLRYYQY